jgi:PKD repeat protein
MTKKSFPMAAFTGAFIFCATAISLPAENTNSFIFIDMGQSGRTYCNDAGSFFNPAGYTRPSMGGTIGRFVGMASSDDAAIDGVSIGNGLIDREVNDTTYGARQINRGVAEVLRWLKWLHPEKEIVYVDLATSGTGIEQVMNNADTERRHSNQRAILDHVESNYGSPNAVIISWYGNDGPTFASYRREWMPYWTGTQLDGTTHPLGTPNPVSTRFPTTPVDVCWYDTTAAIDQRGRGDVTRLTKIAHIMHPNDEIDPASRAEFQAFHNDPRILPASLGNDHFQPMSGHADPANEWEQPLVSIQTLGSALLRALGHSYQPPQVISVAAAANGSYADAKISLPNGGNLTTTRAQNGIPMPALPNERHIEVYGFELARNGVAVGSRSRLRRMDSAAAANIKAAISITDSGSGSGTNRTATVRITPQVPFVEGDRFCYLMGGMSDNPPQTEQSFFSKLIEEVPELRQPGQLFTFPGFIVASSDTALDISFLPETPAAPTASFTASPASGVAPLTVTFTDTSTGTITNRFWDFGDGSTTNTTTTSIAHTYTSAGTSTVQLIVSGPLGVSTNTKPAAITVAAPIAPTANFSASPVSGTAPLAVTFTDSSTGSITNRFWDFGDGIITNTAVTNVVHTYSTAGSKTVTLIVSGLAGTSTNTQASLISVSSGSTGGLIVYDSFSSATGMPAAATGPSGWVSDGTLVTTAHGYVREGSLTSPGLKVPAGNSFNLGTRTDDYWLNFTATSLNVGDTVYFSFLERINVIPASGFTGVGGFIRLGNSVDALSATKGVCFSRGTTGTPTNSNLGFALSPANKTFGVAGAVSTLGTYDMMATYFVVASYTRGATNGSLSLWINPDSATFGTDTPPAATLSTTTANSVGVFDRLQIGSNGSVSHPGNWQIDEVRIATSWAGVAPSASSAPNNDTDSDGLPNDWEAQHFGGSTNANPNSMAANGLNTVLEAYVAGLNPTNPASRFAVSNNWNTLHWIAASGRVYSVYWTTNLLNGFQPLETNIVWPQKSWTDAVHGAQGGNFYRIGARLAP